MAFYEVSRGYVGLGSTTIFRTAAQSAADLDVFSKDAGAFGKQGGLLTQERVFTYSVGQGRLKELQDEVTQLEQVNAGLMQKLEGKVKALEKLGVMKAGDYIRMAAKMATSKAIPLIGWMSTVAMFGSLIGIDLSFLDVFGTEKKKKKKAQQLIKECDAIMTEMAYWADRRGKLNSEGEALAKTIKDKGPGGVDVKVIEQQQHREVKNIYTDVKDHAGIVKGLIHTRTDKQVVTREPTMYGHTVLQTQDEITNRANLAPFGDRLPVGFQTIYSPVLKQGKIVAKIPQANSTLPNPVDRRVVYGGLLSGFGDDTSRTASWGAVILMGIIGLYVATKRV